MKPIRQQFREAVGVKSWHEYRDFTVTVIAGMAILFGVIFWMQADSLRSPFDLKVAVGCFALAAVCVFLASNRALALGCAAMIPGAMVGYHAVITGDRKVLWFYFLSIAVGFLILVLGTLAKTFWHGKSVQRSD